ncbi:MAG: S8 family serine peptidase [Lachnospiraceae bacterium]|nr:S8 family serine peptidase [Lachnospiraceae bacterium]
MNRTIRRSIRTAAALLTAVGLIFGQQGSVLAADIGLADAALTSVSGEASSAEEASGRSLSQDDRTGETSAAGEAAIVASSFPRLTAQQISTAAELKEQIRKMEGMASGERYASDEAVFAAESKEAARKAAEQYGAVLKSFACGVAVLSFGRDAKEALSDIVETMDAIRQVQDLTDTAISRDSAISKVADGDAALENRLRNADVGMLPETAVEPNYIYRISVNPEDDPLYRTSRLNPKGQWFHQSISSSNAWALGATGKGVTVCVIDTGIDSSNNDLKDDSGHIKSLYTASFSTGEDENGHGTHCAGIVAGLDNDLGGLGVAPEAKILSIRAASAEGGLRGSDIAEALQKAINNNSDVISMSFGGPDFSDVINNKVQAAVRKGIVCIAAAGNESIDNLTYPACYEGVISVGAYDDKDELASYSNHGSWVSLAAPGSAILSTMPVNENAVLRKKGSFKDVYKQQEDGCSYGKLNGTSMAAPVAAGVAALVKSMHPDYTGREIGNALIHSNPEAVYSSDYGTVKHGINALNAVNYVPGTENVPDQDYLYLGVGPAISIKQGRSVNLGLVTSLDTKKLKVKYVCSDDEFNRMIKVDSKGKVRVSRNAEPGSIARITATCGNLSASTIVTVLDKDTASPSFRLTKSSSETLSTVPGWGTNMVSISMNGGNPEGNYRYVISNRKVAKFSNGASAIHASGSDAVIVKAMNNGKTTITAYATDGSDRKASVTIQCMTPITGVNIRYGSVPLEGEIVMAARKRIQLSPAAVGINQSKVSGRVKYAWSGKYVGKNGVVTAPDYTDGKETFLVTLTAENNGRTFSSSLRIRVGRQQAVKRIGYYRYKKKYVYYSSIDLNGAVFPKDEEITQFAVMPELTYGTSDSRCTYGGPCGYYVAKPGNIEQTESFKTNNGAYAVSVAGRGLKDVHYGSYGVTGFTPTKAGEYQVIYRMLDGSGKVFVLKLHVK